MTDDLMMAALAAAVPLWMHRLRDMCFEERQMLAVTDADIIASSDTVIEYKPPGKCDIRPAESLNTIARGIAIGALQPLGVTFAGRHWCADHRLCERAEAAAERRLAQIQPPVAQGQRQRALKTRDGAGSNPARRTQ
jgi:hypothetical protein